MFSYVPTAGAVTFTPITQVLLAPMLPSEKEIVVPPAEALTVGVPHPAVETFAGLAIVICSGPGSAGSVSVKFSPVSGAPFGLMMVKVSRETPFTMVGSGLKFLEIVSEAGSMIEMNRVFAR